MTKSAYLIHGATGEGEVVFSQAGAVVVIDL
jgi:hypothetical protein